MSKVVRLARSEAPDVDERALDTMRVALGEKRFCEVVEDAVIEMIERLGHLEVALAAKEFPSAHRIARALSTISGQMGLEDFADTARDLEMCLVVGDQVAIDSVAARLIRLGDASLFSALEMADRQSL